MARSEITLRVSDIEVLRNLLDAVRALLAEMAEADDDRYEVPVQRVEAALSQLAAGRVWR